MILTRSTDVFIPLEERTAIANSRGADLFLSIHANASRNPTARGIETYFLSFAQNPHAEEVAARENAISAATLKDLQGLVKAITLNSKIDESRDFATSVQEAMVAEPARPLPRVRTGACTRRPSTSSSAPTCRACSRRSPSSATPRTRGASRPPSTATTIARSLFKGVRAYLESLARPRPRVDGLSPRALQWRREVDRCRRSRGESVIWIKVAKPTFDLVGVLLSSLGLTGVLVVVAVVLGVVFGLSLIIRRRREALGHGWRHGLPPTSTTATSPP